MEIVLYGGAPHPWPPPTVEPQPALPSQPYVPLRPNTTQVLESLAKKRVRVAVRIDETGTIHLRLEGPNGLAAEISGKDALTLETEV